MIWPTASTSVSACAEFNWEEKSYSWYKGGGFFSSFSSSSSFNESTFFVVIWFTIIAEGRWHFGIFPSYQQSVDKIVIFLCRLPMCGICELNYFHLGGGSSSLLPCFGTTYLKIKMTAELNYIPVPKRNALWVFNESSKQAAFDILFSGIVWTHKTFQARCHQGHFFCSF